MLNPLSRVARPDRFRVSLTDAGGGLPLPLASPRTRIIGLAVGLACLVLASIAWQQSSTSPDPRGAAFFDQVMRILRLSWVLGLWVGVLVLFLLALALLLYRESARVANRRLIHVARLGPVRVFLEYDLADVRDLRAEDAGGGTARIRFRHGDRDQGLGAELPLAEAEARVTMIQSAMRRASQAGAAVPEAPSTP